MGGCAGAARGCGPTPEPFHTTKLCTTGMLFTPKAFQGSEKSTVDLFSVDSVIPSQPFSLSAGNHGMCLTLFSCCCCFFHFCVSPRHSPHPPHHLLYGTGWLGPHQQYGASTRSRARDPRTPSTAPVRAGSDPTSSTGPKAPLLARKASRALHIIYRYI